MSDTQSEADPAGGGDGGSPGSEGPAGPQGLSGTLSRLWGQRIICGRLNKLSDPIIFPDNEGSMTIVKKPTTYSRFDSKYFYMNGFNYYLNIYFRF